MIKTVIVEDDLMVASINQQFALKTPGVNVIATFHNGKDALAFLNKTKVDLPSFSTCSIKQNKNQENPSIINKTQIYI